MITYGGRVLNTYKTNPVNSMNSSNSTNLKGGSDPNSDPVNSNPVISNPINSVPSSVSVLHGGADNFDSDEFKERLFEVFKEEPKQFLSSMVNAQIRGTMIGQFLGSIAWPLSWVWWVLVTICMVIYYFILFCIVMFFINVIQSGLNLVHGAIDGVLIPLKAVYNIKILGARLFGFLGGPVRSLQKTKDGIGKTTYDLFMNFVKKMLE